MKIYNRVPAFRWCNGDSIPEAIMPIPVELPEEDEWNQGGRPACVS